MDGWMDGWMNGWMDEQLKDEFIDNEGCILNQGQGRDDLCHLLKELAASTYACADQTVLLEGVQLCNLCNAMYIHDA